MSAKLKALGAACALCVAVSGYVFNQRSTDNLLETRPQLQELSHCALQHSPVYFIVVDGGRTEAEHKNNVKNGKSWIKRSRHQDGAAIDFAAVVDGKVTYDPEPYYKIASAYYMCSKNMNIPIVWGGEWKVQDLMHIELDRRFYP